MTRKNSILIALLLGMIVFMFGGCGKTPSVNYGVSFHYGTSWRSYHGDYHHHRPPPNISPPERPGRPTKPVQLPAKPSLRPSGKR